MDKIIPHAYGFETHLGQDELDLALQKMPKHVAIIMDGNGRWAQARSMPRAMGHAAGVEALRRTVQAALDFKLQYLTVYSFSSENWNRPEEEIQELLRLMKAYVATDLQTLREEGVRVRVIGERENLEPSIVEMLGDVEASTAHNSKLNLTIAFNYGSQQEIVSAAKKLAQNVLSGKIQVDDINENTFASVLHTHDLPELDLLIRTSGEERISNFLLWQSAYTEMMFLPMMWPEFNKDVFAQALKTYAMRDRRFGGC